MPLRQAEMYSASTVDEATVLLPLRVPSDRRSHILKTWLVVDLLVSWHPSRIRCPPTLPKVIDYHRVPIQNSLCLPGTIGR